MHVRGIGRLVAYLVVLGLSPLTLLAQDGPVATFKAGVDLVSVSAVVRDKKGRVVRALTPKDFVTFVNGLSSDYKIVRPDTIFKMMRTTNHLPADPLKSK